jgi:hypothetical protein
MVVKAVSSTWCGPSGAAVGEGYQGAHVAENAKEVSQPDSYGLARSA